MQISKREEFKISHAIMVRIIAIVLALIVSGIIIMNMVNINPVVVYTSMFKGALSTTKRTWITLRDTAILTCVAVGLAPAFKMRFWNIGAEGQMLVGATATAFVMINFTKVFTGIPLLVVMGIASIIAGALWGIIPAFFKAKFNTNETLFTLMMNYIALQLTSFCVALWENPKGSNNVGVINSKTKLGWIGDFFPSKTGYNTDCVYLLIITVIIMVFVFVYLKYTKHGFEIRVIGDSENTAKYAGIQVDKVYIRTMALSGALCAFAGFLTVACASHSISVDTAGGRGFTAIIVAWIAKMNPFIMSAIAFMLVFLEKGAIQIASDFSLNEYVSSIITGIILLFIIGSEFFIYYKVKFTHKSTKKGDK